MTLSMTTENTNPEDEVMCHCSGTKRGDIQTLFEQGKDMDAISRWTGASRGAVAASGTFQIFFTILQSKRKTTFRTPLNLLCLNPH